MLVKILLCLLYSVQGQGDAGDPERGREEEAGRAAVGGQEERDHARRPVLSDPGAAALPGAGGHPGAPPGGLLPLLLQQH